MLELYGAIWYLTESRPFEFGCAGLYDVSACSAIGSASASAF